MVLQLFFSGVQQFIELRGNLLTANGLQVYPVKANKLLVSWSLFLSHQVTKIALPSLIDLSTPRLVPCSKSLFPVPPAPMTALPSPRETHQLWLDV